MVLLLWSKSPPTPSTHMKHVEIDPLLVQCKPSIGLPHVTTRIAVCFDCDARAVYIRNQEVY